MWHFVVILILKAMGDVFFSYTALTHFRVCLSLGQEEHWDLFIFSFPNLAMNFVKWSCSMYLIVYGCTGMPHVQTLLDWSPKNWSGHGLVFGRISYCGSLQKRCWEKEMNRLKERKLDLSHSSCMVSGRVFGLLHPSLWDLSFKCHPSKMSRIMNPKLTSWRIQRTPR